MRISPDKSHRQNLLLLGQGNREIGERIEGHRDFLADGASQLGLVLTRKEVDDFRVVPLTVIENEEMRRFTMTSAGAKKSSGIHKNKSYQ